jgi:hypothetical protein
LIQLPSTSKIRGHIVNDICGTNYYDHGVAAAVTALYFGYDAPIGYIAGEIAKLMPALWANFREVWCSIGAGMEDFNVDYFAFAPEFLEKKDILDDA